jgi:hypothetical protein
MPSKHRRKENRILDTITPLKITISAIFYTEKVVLAVVKEKKSSLDNINLDSLATTSAMSLGEHRKANHSHRGKVLENERVT